MAINNIAFILSFCLIAM